MTEIRIDPVTALMPAAPRSVPPAMAFASYLDQAWSFTAAMAPVAKTRNGLEPGNPSADAPSKSSRPAAAPAEPARDDARNRRTKAGPDEGGTQVNKGADRPDDIPAEGTPEEAANSSSPQNDSSQQEQPADSTAGSVDAPDDPDSQSPEDADEDPVVTEDGQAAAVEHDAAQVACLAEVSPGHAADGDAHGTGDSSENVAGGSPEDMADVSSQSKAERREGAGSDGANEASSGDGESSDEGQELSPSREVMADDGSESERTDGSREAAEVNESGSRRGRPATAREAAPTRVTRPADSHHSPGADSPPQPVTSAVPASHAPASMDAAAVAVETGHPPTTEVPVTRAEGTAPGTERAATAEAGSRPGTAAPNAPEADQANGVDRVRFVQRVVRAFQATGERGGTVRLRLSPPELGSLRVEISVNQGVMNARLEAENQTARQLLLENLPMLRERLADQGIKVEQFQVDLSDRPPGGLSDWSNDRPQPDRTTTDQGRAPAGRGGDSEEADATGPGRPRRTGRPSQLDVLV